MHVVDKIVTSVDAKETEVIDRLYMHFRGANPEIQLTQELEDEVTAWSYCASRADAHGY